MHTQVLVERMPDSSFGMWYALGDNLTAKRRSVHNETLCKTVYAKMNKHLIPNDMLPASVEKEDAPMSTQFNAEVSDLVEYAEFADTEREIERELTLQLAGSPRDVGIIGDSGEENVSVDDNDDASSQGEW